MSKRKITDPFNVKFEPFDNYGSPIPGMSWHKITYSKKTGQGTYILKMDAGAKSKLHEHINFEEFIMLDGELIDLDNKILKIIRNRTSVFDSRENDEGWILLPNTTRSNN